MKCYTYIIFATFVLAKLRFVAIWRKKPKDIKNDLKPMKYLISSPTLTRLASFTPTPEDTTFKPKISTSTLITAHHDCDIDLVLRCFMFENRG